MPEYLVVWKIDLDADTPTEAAKKALEIQRDPDSIALVFEVYENKNCEPEKIDLLK